MKASTVLVGTTTLSALLKGIVCCEVTSGREEVWAGKRTEAWIDTIPAAKATQHPGAF